MKNEEILKKAIEKAIKNGWKAKIDRFSEPIITDNEKFQTNPRKVWEEIIDLILDEEPKFYFYHDFAKAFWGETEWSYASNGEKSGYKIGENGTLKRGWQYHLQQMVIEEDPIKYLEKFI